MVMTIAMGDPAATYDYVGTLVDELARAGVRHACICPGSRSTPLALTLAACPAIKVWMHIDERSAAFFALGLAKASGTAVALVCTSGTAAANFLPAIVEARYGRVPLLALTADRPPELRDIGAPQAIDQIHLYGGNVKWFVEMALPEASEPMLRYARATAARAVATALEGPAGPVHLNLPFREPLSPPPDWAPDAAFGRQGTQPYTSVLTATSQNLRRPPLASEDQRARLSSVPPPPAVYDQMPAHVDGQAAHDLAGEIVATPRGLIVCGPQADPRLAAAIAQLARDLDYPILADPLSQLRCGAHYDKRYVRDTYDAFLRDERATALSPDLILRFGAPPTSKALQAFLQGVQRQILVDPDGGWRDPSAQASLVVRADAPGLRASVLTELSRRGRKPQRSEWLEAWQAVDRRARAAVTACLDGLDEPFEGKVFAELAKLLPDGATLFAGNSMPVRDLETFFPGSTRDVRLLCNRGANGIDGVVSSALGAAAAGNSPGSGPGNSSGNSLGNGPLVLVIGDLSFYHDLNGLLAARRHDLSATIVLLNNDGGGIFSFLPQAAQPQHFEEVFGTPTGLDFKPAVEMYGCGYEPVCTWPAFASAVAASLVTPGVQVIELRTDRARNVALHRAVWTAVAECVWDE